VSGADATALMRALLRDVLATRDGRELAREILAEFQQVDEEAPDADSVSADVDESLARARRADRRRGRR
jgi:hypothetical protein